MRLRISARKSQLAQIQAKQVGEALKRKFPDLILEYVFRESLGDRNLADPLWKSPEKGVFTKDFQEDLHHGRTDLVVHSWKDLPVDPTPGLEVVATLHREDARDMLLFLKSSFEKQTPQILCSSPRRMYNLGKHLPDLLPWKVKDLSFKNVRGNIGTRIKKLLGGEGDGLIVAKAAIDRLLSCEESKSEIRSALEYVNWMVLPLSLNPAAAAQGALACEIKSERLEIRSLLESINHQETFEDVKLEREILKTYGGGCHQKIGITILSRPYGKIQNLQGITDRGETLGQRNLIKVSEPKRAKREQVFVDEVQWFERIPKGVNLESLECRNLWIARASAFPQEYQPSKESKIWCAGEVTWKSLASRGVWVNGCAEGLGESEDPRLQVLCGDLNWLKLTHGENGSNVVATYELAPTNHRPDFSGKTHFFWKSASSFKRALELEPSIKTKHHSCGPGHTYHEIKAILGDGGLISIHLDFQSWLKEIVE